VADDRPTLVGKRDKLSEFNWYRPMKPRASLAKTACAGVCPNRTWKDATKELLCSTISPAGMPGTTGRNRCHRESWRDLRPSRSTGRLTRNRWIWSAGSGA